MIRSPRGSVPLFFFCRKVGLYCRNPLNLSVSCKSHNFISHIIKRKSSFLLFCKGVLQIILHHNIHRVLPPYLPASRNAQGLLSVSLRGSTYCSEGRPDWAGRCCFVSKSARRATDARGYWTSDEESSSWVKSSQIHAYSKPCASRAILSLRSLTIQAHKSRSFATWRLKFAVIDNK